jgi:hypothetical protein
MLAYVISADKPVMRGHMLTLVPAPRRAYRRISGSPEFGSSWTAFAGMGWQLCGRVQVEGRECGRDVGLECLAEPGARLDEPVDVAGVGVLVGHVAG